MGEQAWTCTRAQLVDAIAGIKVRGTLLPGRADMAVAAEGMADAILEELPRLPDDAVTVSREDLLAVLGADWASPEMRAALGRIQYVVSGSLSCPRCSGLNPNVCTCLRHCGHLDCAGRRTPVPAAEAEF